jgi:hypothetical protein
MRIGMDSTVENMMDYPRCDFFWNSMHEDNNHVAPKILVPLGIISLCFFHIAFEFRRTLSGITEHLESIEKILLKINK